MPEPTVRRVASNTAIQIAGKGVVLAAASVSVAIVTRYLGPDGYGQFALAMAYFGLFAVLADAGLYTIVVRELSTAPERSEELVGNALTLRVLFSLAVVPLAVAVSFLFPYSGQVRIAILIVSVSFVLGLVNTSMVAVFQSRMRMGNAVAGETAGRVAGLAALIVVVALDLGFYAVVSTVVFGLLVTVVITFVLTRRLVRVRPLGDRRVWRKLLVPSIPIGIALALTELYFRADTVIISLFRSYEDVGQYALAYRILEFTVAFATVLLITVFPLLSRFIAERDARVNRTIQAAFDLFVVAGVGILTGGWLLAPQIVHLAGGDDFSGAVEPLQLLLTGAALAFVNGLFGYALIAKDRQRKLLWLTVIGLTFNVALNLALVPSYGIVAAASVTLASEVVILAGSYVLMQRHLDFFPRLSVVPKSLVAGAAMALALLPVRDGSLAYTLPLGLVVYVVVVYAVRGVDRDLLRRVRG